MQISIPIHTVVTLVGPSNSGKSTFAKVKLEELRDKYPSVNFHLVSSDDIRRELIGQELHKYDDEMMYVSQAAFNHLYNRLENLISFPLSIKNAVVVVDTTGLSEGFREDIRKIAVRHNYHNAAIVFSYKDYQDYFKNTEGLEWSHKKIIEDHVKRLRTKVLPNLKVKEYSAGVHQIRKQTENFSEVDIELSNYSDYTSHFLPTHKYVPQQGENGLVKLNYSFIGDVHGCYEEFLELIQSLGFEIDGDIITGPIDKKLVLVGDIIDKGPQIKEMINFVHKNSQYIYLTTGNHEAWVVKNKRGEIKEKNPEILKFFDSGVSLKDTPEMDILEALYFSSRVFWIHSNFIVSHAPCEVKHLGKLDKDSLKEQLKHRYPYSEEYESLEDYTVALEKNLKFMSKQAVFNYPYIFNGHIPVKDSVRLGSQIMLDTGAVYGNKLTGVNLIGKKLEYKEVKSKHSYSTKKEELPRLFSTEEDVVLDKLESRDKKRILFSLGKNPINFISGTMSPADKKDNELESLEAAINYYREKGITNLVMQPKFMGSRCQFYYLPNKEDCYLVSRGGYIIKQIDSTSVIDKWHSLVQEKFPDATLVILDGELLPWGALGKGLIDQHFHPIYYGMKAELEFQIENGFDEGFAALLSLAKGEFSQDRSHLSKAELKSKYGEAGIGWYEAALKAGKYLKLSQIELGEVEVYKTELDGYTQEEELHFQPFQVLKIERAEKVEVLPFDNYQGFKLFNDNAILNLDLEINLDLAGDIEKINQDYQFWFRFWREESMTEFGYSKLEGVVIKPLDSHADKVAPYLKVRHPDYLRLVYGPSYTLEPNYSKLVASKRVRSKVRSSIKEWELGKELLSIPYLKLTSDNKQAINLLAKFIAEEKEVETFDPRL